MEKNMWSSEGRISRKTYWLRVLITCGISFGCGLISLVPGEAGVVVSSLVNLVLGCFLLVQGVKRMHDVDRSGWFLLIPIYNLVLALTPGTVGFSRFGADPKTKQ